MVKKWWKDIAEYEKKVIRITTHLMFGKFKCRGR